jgi:hypothetical protein
MNGELESIYNYSEQLTSNPGHPDIQRNLYQHIQNLISATKTFENIINPAQAQALEDIGATPYFGSNLPLGIESLMASSGVVPSVVRDRVVELRNERLAYLASLEQTRQGLRNLNVAGDGRSFGIEAGFLIPRALFSNSLGGLGKEFEQIEKIIGVFSEISTGSIEKVELRQVSTTDPLVIVALATPVAIAFSKGVDWVLESLKKVIELKGLYDQSKAMNFPDSLTEGMKVHINESISLSLKEYKDSIMDNVQTVDEGRKNELDNHLKWALEQLFSKVERGMTVEIRLLPPPIDEEKTDEERNAQAQAFADLKEIAKRLEFPKLSGEPLLALERYDEPPASP